MRRAASGNGGEAGSGAASTFLRALRADPAHASELAVLYALPQFAAHVAAWRHALVAGHPSSTPEQLARRQIRRTVGLARRDGAVSGGSFYIGMPAALISVFCHQVLLVVQIAALYGRDPVDPWRAADVLVIQGRATSVDAAAQRLQQLTAARLKRPRPSARQVMAETLRQVPGMIGVKLRSLRGERPIDVVLSVAQWASYLVPIIGIPACAAASARATKKLGAAAVAFYSGSPAPPDTDPGFTLPPRPSPRRRRRLVAAVLTTAGALVVLVVVFSGGLHGLRRHWLATTVAELFLIITFGRLLWTTRPPRAPRPADR